MIKESYYYYYFSACAKAAFKGEEQRPGHPTKPFIFCFSPMIDAYETTT